MCPGLTLDPRSYPQDADPGGSTQDWNFAPTLIEWNLKGLCQNQVSRIKGGRIDWTEGRSKGTLWVWAPGGGGGVGLAGPRAASICGILSEERVQTLVSSTPFSVPKVILSPESVQFSIKLWRKSVAELFLELWGVCYETRHRLRHSWNREAHSPDTVAES